MKEAMGVPRWGVQRVVREATRSAMSSCWIMYLASNPPMEWAMRFTFSAPVSRRILSISALSWAAFPATVPKPSTSLLYTVYPWMRSKRSIRPQDFIKKVSFMARPWTSTMG